VEGAGPRRARFLVLWSTPTDVEAFEQHYWTVHIPSANRMTRLRSYTVSRGITLVRGEEPYFLVGELEWDSLDDLRADFASPEGRATAQDVVILSSWSPGVRSMIYEVAETRGASSTR
jgi:uncharacterized protein (TIGR02118 family)